jgi:uroporphyrinogen III methyltransferase/synthase
MSAEIESLTVESAARRSAGGGSPVPAVLAAVALVLAAAAHWRFNRFDDRIDGVRDQVARLEEQQQQSSARLEAVAIELETSNAALREEVASLRVLPAQIAELGSVVEELNSRTAGPQRAWARAEALYLLELAQRRIELERDTRTAIIAMESADARLAMVGDPGVRDVRRLLALELGALRAVPAPDVPAVLARLLAIERTVATLPVEGVPVAPGARTPPAAPDAEGGFARFWRRLSQAVDDLVSLRRIDPDTATLVTLEAESLRRQHLELLLLSARTAAAQQDGAAYTQALQAAQASLARYFDLSATEAARVRDELAALAEIEVDPPRPAVGGAARALRGLIQVETSSP